MREKKMTFYEVDPRYFKDDSGDGTGDLNGLANKFDYFNYIGIDALILKNVIAVDSIKDVETSFTQVAPEIGDINSLKVVISKAKSAKKRVLIDLNIGFIKENNNWFKSAKTQNIQDYANIVDFKTQKENPDIHYGYTSETKKYFVQDEKTQEVPLNWKNDQVLHRFFDVIRFWHKIGVDGFVLKNFEFLDDEFKTNLMSEYTLKELRKFYRGIKEIGDKLILVGRSRIIPIKTIKNYTDGPTKVFHYFLSDIISQNGLSTKYGKDIIGRFSVKQLAKDIQLLANDNKNILSFDSEYVGRSLSRWGNDLQFQKESAKALATLLHLTGASSNIYYGSEIGTPNIGMTHLDNFQDKELKTRRAFILSKKFKEKDFMDAQVLQGAINARALMAWDDGKNGGFSTAEKTITPSSTTYEEINIKNQYGDINSVLSFSKSLIELINKPTYSNILQGGHAIISSVINGVIKYIFKNAKKEKELVVFVNLSNSNRPILKKVKDGKVILSSYDQKKYDEYPKTLEPYEAIVISKQIDEDFKATPAIKNAQLKNIEKQTKEKLNQLKLKDQEVGTHEKVKIQVDKEKELEMAKIAQIAREKQKDDLEKLKAKEKAAKAVQELREQSAKEKRQSHEKKQKEANPQQKLKPFEHKQQQELSNDENQTFDSENNADKQILQESSKNDSIYLSHAFKDANTSETANKNHLGKQKRMEGKDASELVETKETELQKEHEETGNSANKMSDITTSSNYEKGISLTKSNNIIHDINKAKEDDFNNAQLNSIDKSHIEVINNDSPKNNNDFDQAKENAIQNKKIDDSYKDHKTKLTEEELAKTTLIDDDFDIDDLFEENNKNN